MKTPECSTCRDTGHRDPSSFDLDCADCSVAEQRAALNQFVEVTHRGTLFLADVAWAIHQRALAMAPKQEPVAFLKFWAARSWGGSGNNDIEYAEGLCVCEKGELGDDKLPAFPVYAAPAVANGATELPRAEFRTDMHIDGKGQSAYSADQMRAYGQACAAAGPDAALINALDKAYAYLHGKALITEKVAEFQTCRHLADTIRAALSGARGAA